MKSPDGRQYSVSLTIGSRPSTRNTYWRIMAEDSSLPTFALLLPELVLLLPRIDGPDRRTVSGCQTTPSLDCPWSWLPSSVFSADLTAARPASSLPHCGGVHMHAIVVRARNDALEGGPARRQPTVARRRAATAFHRNHASWPPSTGRQQYCTDLMSYLVLLLKRQLRSGILRQLFDVALASGMRPIVCVGLTSLHCQCG